MSVLGEKLGGFRPCALILERGKPTLVRPPSIGGPWKTNAVMPITVHAAAAKGSARVRCRGVCFAVSPRHICTSMWFATLGKSGFRPVSLTAGPGNLPLRTMGFPADDATRAATDYVVLEVALPPSQRPFSSYLTPTRPDLTKPVAVPIAVPTPDEVDAMVPFLVAGWKKQGLIGDDGVAAQEAPGLARRFFASLPGQPQDRRLLRGGFVAGSTRNVLRVDVSVWPTLIGSPLFQSDGDTPRTFCGIVAGFGERTPGNLAAMSANYSEAVAASSPAFLDQWQRSACGLLPGVPPDVTAMRAGRPPVA